ncbi:V4R domain-containing protein [Methanonatronarchaeum sp. AMET6-2]|uniref:V4R domain-containing protein n=1 Tax=Methanonatronarchaeum sp. AMET6-2 TaxID=2933293 RepID=UPI0012220D0E|nr:V4R domain-containing protein [Methanonatronarchaeum sp. AMET6-2]RZN61465.1 MAG: ArsR family transcriptional regulator [Methanonatronarchaeia archaeon]UOY09970.1 ArsR family transcriptional regulator [Methanonatronarchaeum sp. AMET6-2]
MQNQQTKLYTTPNGALPIKSKTKNQILQILQKQPQTGTQISRKINKSKSTTSVHLQDLQEKNLIKTQKHPEDARKKIYKINTEQIAKTSHPEDKNYQEILKNIQNTENTHQLLKGLFHTIRYGLDKYGIDIHPALKQMGRDIGKALAPKFQAQTKKQLLKEIKEYWKKHNLGHIEIQKNTITVKDCFDCSDMPNVGKTLCSLDEGIIEGIIETKTQQKTEITETECNGLGHNKCKFKIKNNEQPE